MFSKNDLVQYLRDTCEALAVTDHTIALAEHIWASWEASGISRPDASVPDIASAFWDEGFFLDVLTESVEIAGHQLDVDYHAPVTQTRNFKAIQLTDGVAVVVDEGFLQLLFFLCMIAWFESENGIVSEKYPGLIRAVKDLAKARVARSESLSDVSITEFEELLGTSFEISEAAIYLFDSFKVFIIGHEIGHHVLKKVSLSQVPEVVGEFVIPTAHQEEFSADQFGLRVFRSLLDRPIQRKYAAFSYRFVCAPALLLSILRIFDQVLGNNMSDVASDSHPKISDRISRLEEVSWEQKDWELYDQLVEAVEMVLTSN
jgi:hypothetical protein